MYTSDDWWPHKAKHLAKPAPPTLGVLRGAIAVSLVMGVSPLRILLALGLMVLAAFALPGSTEAASLNEVKKLTASDAEAFDQFGLSVAVSGDTAVIGAFLEDVGGNNAGTVYVYQRDQGGAGNWGKVKKLFAFDAQAGDNFGLSVAISSDTVVVGSPREDVGGSQFDDFGAAYIFQRNEGGADNWGQVAKLTASDALLDDQFGWSVAISGDIAVIGIYREVAGGNDAGAAYVFRRDEGGTDNWGEVKRLTAFGAKLGDEFGISVAVSGDTAVVGASRDDAGGSDAGAAYVFQRNEGGADTWGEVKKLTASDGQAFDQFGGSVAISGDTAVVGATGNDAKGFLAGAAYVFRPDQGGAGNWGEVIKLTASDSGEGDSFGRNVAVSGDTAVVGATGNDAKGFLAGAAYAFQRDEGGAGNWGELKKLTASDAGFEDRFGWSVAISGDIAVIGVPYEDAGGLNAGAAYVFQEPPPPVGGISLDSDLRSLPLETPQSSSPPWVVGVGIAGAACVFALGGAAWYARRRREGS